MYEIDCIKCLRTALVKYLSSKLKVEYITHPYNIEYFCRFLGVGSIFISMKTMSFFTAAK